MMKQKQLTLNEFVLWYENEFSSGDLRSANYLESANYLAGLRDGLSLNDSSEKRQEIERAIACLRGAANAVEKLQYLAARGASDVERAAMKEVQRLGASHDEVYGESGTRSA